MLSREKPRDPAPRGKKDPLEFQCPGHNLSAEEFGLFRDLIYTNCGICLNDDRKDLLANRLRKRLQRGNFGSYSNYYEYVISDKSGREMVQLINMISTNLTYFFREPKHFELLAGTLLPQILKDKMERKDRRIRLWSAACSTGEEVYSLLITILTCLEPLTAWDFKMLGSDISTEVLFRAKNGCYDRTQVKGLDPALISDYFYQRDDELTVRTELKRLVKFARLNLLEPFPFKGRFDVIFCRNVMIYFDQQTREHLVNKFYKYLTPGGYLFIGHSENLTGLNHEFCYVGPAVYRK